MAARATASPNITNRSPWLVEVRAHPDLDRRFSYPHQAQARDYCAALAAQGRKARLRQLETAFELRIRRAGMKVQRITFDTWRQAEQARLHLEARLAVSVVRDYAVATQVRLCELMQRYLDDVVPGHKGREVEANRLRRLMRDEPFVEKKLAALCTEDLQDFITDRLTEVAPATVDREIDLISQVLHYADDVWKIAPVESPLKGLRRPRYFNERDRRLSPREEAALLAAARADENSYVEPAILLALETAMRRGELLALTRADIDVDRRCAIVRQSKNGRQRRVPLSSRALQVIAALPETDSGVLLELTPNALQIAFFRRVIPVAGLVDFHFHDLRHEAVSRLAESGRFQLIELQAISGHRDMRMLQRYAHLCSGNLALKMDAIREGVVKHYVHRGRKRVVVHAEVLVGDDPAPGGTEAAPAPALPGNVVAFPARRRA